MANKAIHWVLAGIFVFLWFYVGHKGYYANEAGDLSNGWWLATLLTVGALRA